MIVNVLVVLRSFGFLGVINPRLFFTPASIVVCLLIPTVDANPVLIPNTPNMESS